MSFKTQILSDRVPNHVAVIMDGNGRWAKKHGEHRIFGHTNGVESVRAAITASAENDLASLGSSRSCLQHAHAALAAALAHGAVAQAPLVRGRAHRHAQLMHARNPR